MALEPDVLDAAFDRLGRWGFDDPDGYVNHGPMVCEALDALRRPAEVDSWSRLDSGTPPATPVDPSRFEWTAALGDPARAGEWIGFFQRTIDDEGWSAALAEWLPRLLPGMGVALYHGAIRSAHATRAIEVIDTPARRAELARALGYWAAVYEPGAPADLVTARDVDDAELAAVRRAGHAARHYLARPNIFNLHGVTSAMAVSILVRHVDEAAATRAVAQVDAEHAVLYEGADAVREVDAPTIDRPTLVEASIASGDAHAVKLVEASLRGFAATDDPVFMAAAERVSRRGRRALEQSPPVPANE